VVGRDPSYDLAVLRISKGGLPVIPMGDSTKVVVGDAVIAIGSPLGLTGTVTSGIVSSLRRPVTTNPSNSSDETSFISAIQTDAAINPGNSGGPLVDAAGRMIGVNSAIATLGQQFSGQSGSIGVGFAIPINQARRVAQQIIRTGGSTFPVIGVQLDRMYDGDGARIAMVEGSGPARSAGLRVGDVIVRIDSRLMSDATDVITTIRSYAPGDVISITVSRGGGTRTVSVKLGSRASL
jgi:putative serine protease PepD